MMGGGYGWNYNGLGGMGLIGPLFGMLCGLVVLAILVILVIWLARRSSGHGSPVGPLTAGGSAASPKDVAKLRYSRGEITREQYLQLLADLDQPVKLGE
jgi:uncharacterized membrane protein